MNREKKIDPNSKNSEIGVSDRLKSEGQQKKYQIMSVKTLIKTRNEALASSLFQDTGVEAEYYIDPKLLTSELLKLATGKTGKPEAYEEDTGLILYPDSIKAVKYYERDGLALPDTENEVDTYLGGYQSEIPGLSNADLLVTFQGIQANAGEWAGIEQSIINISIDLDIFAQQEMLKDGVRVCEWLDEIIFNKVNEDLEISEIDPDQLDDPDYVQAIKDSLDEHSEVTEEDINNLELCKRTIDRLTEKAQDYYNEANTLLDDLQTFKDGLRACSSDVNSKEELCDELNIEGELEEAKAELDDLNKQLENKQAEYDKEVGLCFTGLVGGAIGIIVTGSIFGTQAADTKDDINDLKKQIEELEDTIDGLDKMLGAITTLDTSLESLFTVMLEAENGLSQIMVAWEVIVELLKTSSDACDEVANSEDVFDLYLNFLDTVDPWEDISGNAQMVTNAFNDALDQWASEQINN